MVSQSDDEQQAWLLGLVFGLIVLVLALVLGLAIDRGAAIRPDLSSLPAEPAPVATAVVASEPAAPAVVTVPAAASAQAVSDAASITVEYGVVKFYFASGDVELAAGASEALVDVVKGARGGKKVLISGFHDARGNAVRNAELARQRALTVRDALLRAGVPDRQIRLGQPVQAAGTGSDAEARRVEIALQ